VRRAVPEWKKTSKVQVSNALDELWNELEQVVVNDPSFEEVTGVSDEIMMTHTKKVVAHYLLLQKSEEDFSLLDPEHWVRLYVMGFVVGTRYGRNNS
jgi:hypothetical protein